MKINLKPAITLLTLLALAACGGGGESGESRTESSRDGLTPFQLEHGIGPVTEAVVLGELDTDLAAKGKTIFDAKCTACHKPTEKYIGPAVGEVLDRRTPAYVMNMIMNPDEMTKKHPEGRKMMQEYMSPMPYQNVTVEEARAIVEYFRTIEMPETES